jgi:hypothetical protein
VCFCLVYRMQDKIETKIGNKSFANVEKYSGAVLTHQNCIHEETKSRLKSGSA